MGLTTAPCRLGVLMQVRIARTIKLSTCTPTEWAKGIRHAF